MSALSERLILPDALVPINYDIYLYDLEIGGAFKYQGKVNIEAVVRKATKDVVLNTRNLTINSAEITLSERTAQQSLKASNISYDEKSQRATISFPDTLTPCPKAILTLAFSGTMNDTMAGFYRSKYKSVGTPTAAVPTVDGDHYMFSTQFESSDARQAFPCFDEPNLKATFDVALEVPEGLTALSNMPEREVRKAPTEGRKVVAFERTPVMSTYLLAWAVGDFDYVEAFTERKYNGKPLPVRVYTTKGLANQGKLALQTAHKTIDLFSEIFDIDYPLPKADLLAVHEFSHGAMENWGLVTYRTTAVLFDEEHSDIKYQTRVAYVVCHELAHQWFGNLVTMDWWSELWLNEGFATWVGWHAIDVFYPEWEVWAQFLAQGYQRALDLDSIRGSHPIEVPVRDALDVDQIFDAISYLKGSSAIRMLVGHLGQEPFLKGVSNYLKKHMYGNAKTQDLWDALSKACEQDVGEYMENWIKKIGFPVVTVAEEPGQISVRQTRFLSTADVKPEDDETIWWIPLNLKMGIEAKTTAASLTKKQDILRDISDEFYKLNSNQSGFFRTNYPPSRLAKLGSMRQKLSTEDKIGLIGDAGALAIAGEGSTPGLLALLENFRDEENFQVWSQILSSLDTVRSVFSEKADISEGLQKFTLELIGPTVDKVGWNADAKENYLTTQLRSLLLGHAGMSGHESTIAESRRQLKAYAAGDKKAISTNLQREVFAVAISNGGLEEFELVHKDYQTTTSIDGKEKCILAMAQGRTPEVCAKYLEFLFSSEVKTQDMHAGAAGLAINPMGRHFLWEHIRDNWESVCAKIATNMVVLDRFLLIGLIKFSTIEVEKDIMAFFKDKDQSGYDRSLAIISDVIRGNAAYLERDEKVLTEWLTEHKYM